MKRYLLILVTLLTITTQSFTQNFSQTFVEYAYGWNNDDFMTGTNPTDGNMHLITLDHVTVTKWGGVYGFVNYMIAPEGFYLIGFNNEIEDSNNGRYRLYSEISPWVSIPGVLGKDFKSKLLRDFSLETQINLGVNYFAGLVGAGFTFNTPYDRMLKVSAYWRRDNIKENTMQITGVFDYPIVKKWGLRVQGFFDLIPFAKNREEFGSTELGTDFLSQTRVLWDIGRNTVFKNDENTKLEIGVDVYMHFNKELSKNDVVTFVPQPCMRLTF